MTKKYDLLDRIIAFENGNMNTEEMVGFFEDLRDTGYLWHLQGLYQRTYFRLIEAGLIKEKEDVEEK